jgi:predicted enzyme related to lactoylglutathione lyase
MSPDVDASKAFYSAVFGWETEDQLDDDGTRVYVMCTLDGKNIAGLGGQQPGMEAMPAFWNSYICVDDVAATVAEVEGAGGSVMMPPMQAMEAGHMAIISDPAGAAVSLWQPIEHKGADVCNEPGTLSWNELMTRDVDASLDFYRTVLGWEIIGQDMGPMGTYHVVRGGENGGWAGIMAMPPDVPDMVPSHWMVYFATADIGATITKVTVNGGTVAAEPFDVPDAGTMAVMHDPQGGSFSLMQHPE